MRVPIQWLHDYVAVSRPIKEVAHLLTMAGLEVTSVETTGSEWKSVVVGHVQEVNPHPNADRLRLVKVHTGENVFEVVCGAKNVAAGQKIAYASLGAELVDAHGGKMILKKAKIRGVESHGMVCSERELGLSDEHEGILVLAEDAPVGRPLAEVLGDTVLVIDMKPNRADGLSVLGVARDVAALTGTTWRDPSFELEALGEPIEGRAEATIEDPDLCARFTLALIEGISIGPSPSWMQERLLAAGMRPINNVVDITNYVMLELGQPIHAFDYDTVRDHHIIVRRAKPGEKLTTLDGKERSFNEDQLLITDPSGPIAVAGVMGGLQTEVTEKTKNILLEVANFDPVSIRRTAMALKLPSEASKRFAWGIAPELAPLGSKRVTQLLVEHASGRAAKGLVDAYPRKPAPVELALDPKRVPQVLGIDPPRETVVRSLTSLGFDVDAEADAKTLKVRPPYWRQDIQYPDDLVEEVARMVGYETVPAEPLRGAVPPRVRQPLRELREEVRDTLASVGMQEIITYPLTSLEVLGRVMPPADLEARPPLSVINPLNVGQECMRTTLRASMLEIVARNVKLTREHLAFFECARVYEPTEKGLPSEREHVAAAVLGRKLDRYGTPTDEAVDFYDAKAYTEALFERLGVDVTYKDHEEYGFLSGRTAAIVSASSGQSLAVMGQIHPETAAAFGIDVEVYLFEIHLEDVLSYRGTSRYQPFSRFPAVVEDLAVVVARDQRAGELLADIEAHPLVASARIFDQYEGEQVGRGKKSIAVAVSYQAPDRTLTDKDVKKAREKILARLRGRFGAELRG